MSWCHCSGIQDNYCKHQRLYKTEQAMKSCLENRDTFLQMEVICGNIEEPTIIEQAANLFSSTAEHFADGMSNVSEEEFNRRISICKQCPLFIANEEKCMLCGCYMNTKAQWRSGKCPDNPPRW